MKLKNAARYFDNDSVTDGYSGVPLFKAQFSSFEESAPDGSFSRRRTVSVAPEVAPADRRVVMVQGLRWIMGELVTDGFKDKPIRKTASAKEVTDLFTLLTPGEAALRSPTGTATAYGHMRYLKDTVNSLTESAYNPQYDVSFAITEDIQVGKFIRSARGLLHVRSVQFANEGYWTATSDELSRTPEPNSAEVDVVFSGEYDPVTEAYGTSTSVTGILIDLYKLYDFKTQADPRNQAGDMTLIIAKSSLTPSPGQELTLTGETWKAIRYTSYADAWNLQIRRS